MLICGVLWPAGARTRPGVWGPILQFGKISASWGFKMNLRLMRGSNVAPRCQGSAKKLTGVLASALNACCGVILVDFIANLCRENYESKEDRRFRTLKHHRRVQGACVSPAPKFEENRGPKISDVLEAVRTTQSGSQCLLQKARICHPR